MTTEAKSGDAVRELAHALFVVNTEARDEAARKDAWESARSEHLAVARKLLRRLEGKGYSLQKTV